MTDIDRSSITWRNVSGRANARLKALVKQIMSKSTNKDQYEVLKAQAHEQIDLLKLDPEFKTEWSD